LYHDEYPPLQRTHQRESGCPVLGGRYLFNAPYAPAKHKALSYAGAHEHDQHRHQWGKGNYRWGLSYCRLEVLTAQGNLLQSELELTTLKTQQLKAVVGLYRALGGGWK
jgi:hypothetical protein